MSTETVDGTPYYIGWVFSLLILLAVTAKARSLAPNPIITTDFKNFQRSFVHIYLIALGSEWLQSCYLFVLLHKSYQFSVSSIAWMFIAGLISCQTIGVLWEVMDVGSRKGRCMLCLGLQAASCLLMLIGGGSFGTLIAARILAGVASSVMQGSFEQWMVDQHFNQGFPDDWLPHTFNQLSYSTARLAAAVGIVGELSVEIFGFQGPYFVSLLLSLLGLGLMSVVWHQDAHRRFVPPAQILANFNAAFRAVQTDKTVLFAILVQAWYEVAICLFAFLWTPLLNLTLPHTEGSAPYGFIFSLFLIAVMVGSFAFKIITEVAKSNNQAQSLSTEVLCQASYLGGSAAFLMLSVMTSQYLVVFFCVVFQLGVGLFYPAMGTLRGKYVPRDARLIILNGAKVVVITTAYILLAYFSHSFGTICVVCAFLLASGAFAIFKIQKTNSVSTSLKPSTQDTPV